MSSTAGTSAKPSDVGVDASRAGASADVDLSSQSKAFLITRVQALEQHVKSRDADCAALLRERQELLPLRAKCESQKELILALREQLSVLQAERDSALDAVEGRQRAARDAEHDALKSALGMNGAAGTAATTASGLEARVSRAANNNVSTGQGGARVIKTAHAGTQIIYDSSDISSLGFQAGGAAPFDFLGGMGAYQGGVAGGGITAPTGARAQTKPVSRMGDDSEDAEVEKAMYRARDEAQLELKHAEQEAQEEARLRARLEALRQGSKKS